MKDKAQYKQKLEEENQDLQKKLLENIEENNHLKKCKQDLIDHTPKIKYDEKGQDEMLRNLQNDKYLLITKLANIHERTSKPLGSKKQVEEKEANTNSVINIVKKEVNPAEEQTTKTPYRHPNYKHHFD